MTPDRRSGEQTGAAKPRSLFARRLRSFGHAGRGIAAMFASEPHARFHALAAVAVVGAGWGFGIERLGIGLPVAARPSWSGRNE